MGVLKDRPFFTFRVTQASLNQTAFDFPRNRANILAALDKAIEDKSDLLCFEELALTGYDCGDDFQKTDNAQILALLFDVARYAAERNPDLLISIGHPYFYADKSVAAARERERSALYNIWNLPFDVQTFIGQGRLLAMTAKSYLFGYERGYEPRYFAAWSAEDADKAGGRLGTISLVLPGQDAPIALGRPIVRWESAQGTLHLAHLLCEEKWVASRFNQPHGTDRDYDRDGLAPLYARTAGREGLVLVMPNASPPAPGKMDKHGHLACLASQYAELALDTDGLGSSGSGFAQFGFRLIAQKGKIAYAGKRLQFARVATDTNDIALQGIDPQSRFEPHVVFQSQLKTTAKPALLQGSGACWDKPGNPAREIEETLRMAALWLFDYLCKTKSQGIAEALSGGADSALNATLVSLMVHWAVEERGVKGFCQEMSHLAYRATIEEAYAQKGTAAAIDVCLRHMLTAVYMGTDNSSPETRAAARALVMGENGAPGIGGSFEERQVQDLLNFYALVYAVPDTTALAPARKADLLAAIGGYLNQRPGLSREALAQQEAALRRAFPEIQGVLLSAADPRHAIAYENIQARARQVLIMAIANAEGKMACANPNLDEARNAYATFGGDLHSGTINLNGFLSKARELRILRHLYEKGLEGIPPLRCLERVLNNKPTAELQPKNAQGQVVQRDEDALQRDFDQMDALARAMLSARTGRFKERRLNPSEVFARCAKDPDFRGVSQERLYNMLCLTYARWALAQHKIHASPIAPTFGANVDHQVSLRTPNLSGGSRAELAALGLALLFEKGRKARLDWATATNEALWRQRALCDETFIAAFFEALRKPQTPGLDYDLEALFLACKESGPEALS